MTISIVGTPDHKNTAGAATTLTTLSWSNVGTINAGDLAIAVLCEQSTTASWTTLPTGFNIPNTVAAISESDRTNCSVAIRTKRCVGGETGAITFGNGNSKYKSGILLVLRGAGEIVSITANNTSASTSCVGVTTVNPTPGAIGLHLVGQQASGSAATWTVPTNYTEATHDSSTTNPSMGVAAFYRTNRGFESSGALNAVSTVTASNAVLTMYVSDASLTRAVASAQSYR